MKASKFLNKYRDYQAKYGFLKLVVLSMVVVQGLQLFGLFYALNKQTVVIVPTSEFSKTFYVSGSSANIPYIEIMGRYVASLYLDYTPDTIQDNYDLLSKFILPSAYPTIKPLLEQKVATIQETQVSQVFFIAQLAVDPVNKEIRLIGTVQRYVSGQQTYNTQATYILKYTLDNGRFYITQIKES